MKCLECGYENAPGHTFCTNCGSPLPAQHIPAESYCARCGAPLEPGKPFCSSCGAPTVETVSPGPAVAPIPPSPTVTQVSHKNSHAAVVSGIAALLVTLAIGGVVILNMMGRDTTQEKPVATGEPAVSAGNSQTVTNPEPDDEDYDAAATDDADQEEDADADLGEDVDADQEATGTEEQSGPMTTKGVGGSYETDGSGLVINRKYMFKFRIPAGYEAEMITDDTMIFRGNGFTVTIDAWYNNGETDESRYKNMRNSLVADIYEYVNDGVVVVSGRDSRGHELYTKEIVKSDRICRMVVDSNTSPCSQECENAIVNFEAEFRLLH